MNLDETVYIMFGVYFQYESELDLQPDALKVATYLRPFQFSGAFHIHPKKPNEGLVGSMLDERGYSILSDIKLFDNQFTFCKQYDGSGPHRLKIQYHFTRNPDGTWSGGFTVPNGNNTNYANCVIKKVTRRFFTHPRGLEEEPP